MADNTVLSNVINDIFAQERSTLRSNVAAPFLKPTTKKSNKADLEFALAVILVDLASCDQNFDQNEYKQIVAGLKRTFGTAAFEVTGLIHRANLALQNLRGTNNFAALLRDSLPVEKREELMKVIDEVIAADGKEDGFELLLRRRYTELLGLSHEPIAE